MQITGHVHALRIPFELPIRPGVSIPRFVYVYLLYGEKEVWLVDAGVAGSETAIFDYLKATNRSPGQIAMILQTHSHPDHIGATPAIRDATGCAVAAHEAEKSWIEDVELQFRQRPVPGFHGLVGGSVKVDRLLGDGDVLRLGGGPALAILHTPGHSPGSISVWIEQDRALICGDAVPSAGGIPIYEDAAQSVRSVERLMEIAEADVLLSSWDEPRRSPQALLSQSLDYLRRIEAAVLQAAGHDPAPESMSLCKRVLAELGLPDVAANPLVARTFMAHLGPRPAVCPCDAGDVEAIYGIINDAAEAYRGVIPADCWHEPYMSREELRREIESGVRFWGYRHNGELIGVMGIQDVEDVTLIRHAYVRTSCRNRGIGGKLLGELRKLTTRPVLIGTWAAATWAIHFYQRHGFCLVSQEEKNRLLKKYWSISDRQIETSVVLAEPSWQS